MKVFVNISSKGCFYSEELCPSAFTGWLELRWAPFLPRSQLLPGTGSIQILSYTLQRLSLVPIRDQSLVAHPSCRLVNNSLIWGPVDESSQSLSSSVTRHTHTFVVPTSETIHVGHLRIVVSPTSIDTIHAGRLPAGSFRPRFNLPTPVFYHLVFTTSVDIPHAGLLHIGSFRPRAPTLVAYNPS
jgi:hypothetical protein